MVLTPDSILTGPRGRRLLLEFALASERGLAPNSAPLSTAVNQAARRLEPGGDRRGWLLSTRVRDRARTRPPNPAVTTADVAQELDRTGLSAPTEDLLRFVLGDVVAFARYWQEPDGADLLTACAELRDPLRRLASEVLSSAATGWWTQSVDLQDQACVQWPEVQGFDPAADPATILAVWGEEQLAGELRALHDRPADPRARFSGLWWSKPPPLLLSTSPRFSDGAPSELYFYEDSFGWRTAQSRRVRIPRHPRVYEIHEGQDWAELCRRFPMDVTGEKRHDWYRTTGRVGRWLMPDWRSVAEVYDGVHLSVAGYLTAVGRVIDVESETASVIAGWNPAETWWFTVDTDLGEELTHWRLDEAQHWCRVESSGQD